ncbi:hypothetical protein [Nonomuraea sp. B19D2]|uniref:hypothetical protein n=1 Tax=Nonomuraea sp. B19D2 TaxID=3159561 RepID=UPI0032DA0EBC
MPTMLAAARAEERQHEQALAAARGPDRRTRGHDADDAPVRRTGHLFPPSPADTVAVGQALPREQSSKADAGPVGKGRPGRGELIRNLFLADPERWWKAREVADALGENGINNVRMSLNHMVAKNRVIKNDDACYRLAPGQISDSPVLRDGSPSPIDGAGQAGPPIAADGSGTRPAPERILHLIRQGPTRMWRPRQVAEAMGLPDVDGVRAVLQKMTARQLLIKNASCRFGLPAGYTEGRAMP